MRTPDRHHGPAHPPGEVRRHLLRRRRQRLQLRGRHLRARRGAASASTAIRAYNGCTPATRATAPSTCPRPQAHPFFGAGPDTTQRSATGSARRPPSSAGTPTRRSTTPATTARCAPSSRTTTSAPRPTSRPASTPAWSSSRRARSWRDTETGHALRRPRTTAARRAGSADIITAEPARELPRVPARVRRLPARLRAANGDAFPDPAERHQPAGQGGGRAARPAARRPRRARQRRAAAVPRAVSADDPGTMVVNYRNEPLALRVRDPHTNTQAAGQAGDLSLRLPLARRRAPTPRSTASPASIRR